MQRVFRFGLWSFLSLALAGLASVPARAQSPEDIVRWIYLSYGQPGPAEAKGLYHLTAPGQRGTFLSRRMQAFFAANDTYGDDLGTACLDFAVDIPGQDFDEAEIVRSLSVTGTGDTTRRQITARFTNFGQPAEVIYEFIPEDGQWRIDDVAGPGYRLSAIPCAPDTAAAAGGQSGATGYCFRTTGDTLRLDIAPDGWGVFDLQSWQENGHSCEAGGSLQPVQGGWVYEEALSGGPCRIGIMGTADGGLRLTDKDWSCRLTLCGARAVIDGITFPAESQVDCAAMPSP